MTRGPIHIPGQVLSNVARSARLRGSGQRDEREMLAPGLVGDFELDPRAGAASDQHEWHGAGRSPWPSGARLEARSVTRGSSSEVDLVGSSRGERFVRSIGVVPAPPQRQLPDEVRPPEGNHDKPPRALALERPHQPLDDRDAAVFAHCAEAVADALSPAPATESFRCELHSPVRDEMARRRSGGGDRTSKEGPDGLR